MFIGGSAGDLDQATTAKPPAVTGGLVTVAHAIGIDPVGERLGLQGAGFRGFGVGEPAGPNLTQARRAVAEVFLQFAEAAAFERALPQEGRNAAWSGDTGLAQRFCQGRDPGGTFLRSEMRGHRAHCLVEAIPGRWCRHSGQERDRRGDGGIG